MRAVFEVMGVKDIVAKCHGSTNPYNMVRATFDGLNRRPRLPKWRPSAASRSKTSSTEPLPENDMANDKQTLTVKLVRSLIGTQRIHRATVAAWACAS